MTTTTIAIIISFAVLLLALLGVIYRAGSASGRVSTKLDDVAKSIDDLSKSMSGLVILTSELKVQVALCHQRLDAFEQLCEERRTRQECGPNGEKDV